MPLMHNTHLIKLRPVVVAVDDGDVQDSSRSGRGTIGRVSRHRQQDVAQNVSVQQPLDRHRTWSTHTDRHRTWSGTHHILTVTVSGQVHTKN